MVAFAFFRYLPVAVPSVPSVRSIFSYIFLVLVGLQSIAHPAFADEYEESINLLSEMSRALREKDYRGIFIYEYAGVLRTMRVTHHVSDGLEYEYLDNVSGPELRIERRRSTTECVSPADRLLRGMGARSNSELYGLSQHYHLYLRDSERVAERDARVLRIVPRDKYRYAYSFSIDKETSLPLVAIIFSQKSGQVLERFQFADLDMTPDDEWVSGVQSSDHIRRPEWPKCSAESSAEEGPFPWAVKWVPSGFVDAGHGHIDELGDVQFFTDGLSSFTVFVKPQEAKMAVQGKAQRGATVAFLTQQTFTVGNYMVTVVGEIPALTAQRIAGSLQPLMPTEMEQKTPGS